MRMKKRKILFYKLRATSVRFFLNKVYAICLQLKKFLKEQINKIKSITKNSIKTNK